MSLTIAPTWGNAASEAEEFWSARDAAGLVRNDDFEAESRLDSEIGYGVGGPLGMGLLTAYAGLTLSDGAERTLRAGFAGTRLRAPHWTSRQAAKSPTTPRRTR